MLEWNYETRLSFEQIIPLSHLHFDEFEVSFVSEFCSKRAYSIHIEIALVKFVYLNLTLIVIYIPSNSSEIELRRFPLLNCFFTCVCIHLLNTKTSVLLFMTVQVSSAHYEEFPQPAGHNFSLFAITVCYLFSFKHFYPHYVITFICLKKTFPETFFTGSGI